MSPRRTLAIVLAVVACLLLLAGVMTIDPRVADTGEHAPSNEEALIAQIRDQTLEKMRKAGRPTDFYERDAHPTPHGCVKAYLTVDADLEARFRHGVFAQPGKTYAAWIRFSNGLQADDRAVDVRGMAIKLMGVPGEKLLPAERHEQTQDFLMINHHTFVVDDVVEFLPFLDYQNQGKPMGYFIGWNPFEWRLRELRVGLQMLWPSIVHQDGPSPLSMAYFSMVPYRLGHDLNIKFAAWPCDARSSATCVPPHTGRPADPSAQFLRERLVADLWPQADGYGNDHAIAARFEFRVQVQDPAKNMPIENASIAWSQTDSPYVRLAVIEIPRQRFSTEEQNRFCENLSFTPWHALPDHEPIGGLNRARREVYEAISIARHEHNGTPRREPRGFCLNLDGKPCNREPALSQRP